MTADSEALLRACLFTVSRTARLIPSPQSTSPAFRPIFATRINNQKSGTGESVGSSV